MSSRYCLRVLTYSYFLKLFWITVCVDEFYEKSHLHSSTASQECPRMWSRGQVHSNVVMWRRSLWGWRSRRGEPVAEGPGSESVEPAAPCWAWEAVWDTAGCPSPGWAGLETREQNVLSDTLHPLLLDPNGIKTYHKSPLRLYERHIVSCFCGSLSFFYTLLYIFLGFTCSSQKGEGLNLQVCVFDLTSDKRWTVLLQFNAFIKCNTRKPWRYVWVQVLC